MNCVHSRPFTTSTQGCLTLLLASNRRQVEPLAVAALESDSLLQEQCCRQALQEVHDVPVAASRWGMPSPRARHELRGRGW